MKLGNYLLLLIVGISALFGLLFIGSRHVQAQSTDTVIVDIFVRDTCQHCKEEKAFFADLEKQRDDFEVRLHNLDDAAEVEKFKKIVEINGLTQVTPITYVSNTVIAGFGTAETTGKQLIGLIDEAKTRDDLVTLDEHLASGIKAESFIEKGATCDDNCEVGDSEYLVDVPFLGIINLFDYSLPVLSILLGFVDGFNPCAMWVLVTFLLILTQVGDRKKMWQIAGLFIIAEAVMYYLILNVWLTAWDFVGLDAIITPVIGTVAIGAGIFFLYEYYSAGNVCKVVGFEKQAKITEQIQKLVTSKFGLATVAGILALAFSVNIIEFACSIGIPQAFTKILELNPLSALTRQFYMFLYIVFYMIDDFIVFGIALYAIDKIHLTSKYSKLSNLLGGILMILLGLILIFKREWLVF